MAYEKMPKEGYAIYRNQGGKEIGAGIKGAVFQDGFAFRDLEGNGKLYPYADWRLSDEERAMDLVSRLSVREMLGLTLHSPSQPVPAMPGQMEHAGTYGGKTFPEAQDVAAWTLTDQQRDMVENRGMRHFLVSQLKDVETAVHWSNAMQALAESLPHGIPVNLSSDPRHGAGAEGAEFRSAANGVSQWPEGLALAACHDEETVRQFAKTMAKEYRALGIVTFLGPQIDLGSDPRWFRIRDTFGSDVEWNIRMTKAFCDGLQTTEGSKTGWGRGSVIAMAKHWPGGGTGEGGRDAHYPFGKYAVYPGGNFESHLRPFTEGAFRLDGKTACCAAIMPYYTVSWQQDKTNHENVGNSYNTYLIRDLLLGTCRYQGVICTDWGIIYDKTPHVGMYVRGGKCHGVEGWTQEERILRLMLNGVNQFGGYDDYEKVETANRLGCERYGWETMEEKLRVSAYKLLLNMFRVGLFDNPYLDVEESEKTVGCPAFVQAGMIAQQKSPVLLKNKNGTFPLRQKELKVYIPRRSVAPYYSFVRIKTQAQEIDPIAGCDLPAGWKRVETPREADAAVVFITSPFGRNGYEFDMLSRQQRPDAGYIPISLQYRPYTASLARRESIAGGDPREASANRSYQGKTEYTANESDLDLVLQTKAVMREKPVIVVIRMDKPAIVGEFEPAADAILADFGVCKQAVFDVLTGKAPARGKLPVLLPADMETVETHCEDRTDDITPYTDSCGSSYGIGFGLC